MGALDAILSRIKIKPKDKDQLQEAEKADIAEQKKTFSDRARKRLEGIRNRANGPVTQNLTVVAGGAAAEFVRRKLVGRFTDNVWAQAVGVAAVGGAAQALDSYATKTGFIKNIGLGHMGAAGFIAAAKAYDKEGAPDPVVVAYQGTTEKYIKDKKKKKKDDDDQD